MIKETLVCAGLVAVMSGVVFAENNTKGFGVNIKVESTMDGPALKPVANSIAFESNVLQTPKASKGFSDTIIIAKGAKSAYHVDEPIKIQVKLKRDAYVYLWTIDSDNGSGYLLLPNNFESFNSYKKDKVYNIPEDGPTARYDFVSDRKGMEQVYVLATDKKIDKDKISEIFSKRIGGLVVKAIASKKNIEQFMTKSIKIIAREQALKFVVKGFKIKITPAL